MNRFLSQKFRFYSFICISLLLYVHGYNLNVTYLTPFSTVEEPLTFTTFIEYFLANGALRFRIPMLFIISGYIYALQDRKSYPERTKRRFITLMIPYFIWSAVGLLITYLLQQFPATAEAVKRSTLDQMGDNRTYEQIGWGGVLYRWLLRPVSFQLWFIRSLFIYNLLYPLLKWLVLRYTVLWLSVVFLFWHTVYSVAFIEGQGLFFFCLGILLCKRNYPLLKKPDWFSWYLSWLFYLGISVIKTFMAFELDPANGTTKYVLYIMHDLTVAAGIVAIWFGADPLVKWCMEKKWFSWATSFSFIIYALHVPFIHYATTLALMYWKNLPNYRLLTYLLVPVIVFLLCIATGIILRKTFPRFYRIATGGRGF